jgi:hypothetical protein
MYSSYPVVQNLYDWEAEYLLKGETKCNVGKTNTQHPADLIRKLQGWETGLEPFTGQDLEEIRNCKLLIEHVDVADAFKDYVLEDKLD